MGFFKKRKKRKAALQLKNEKEQIKNQAINSVKNSTNVELITFSNSIKDELTILFDKYGSDKGSLYEGKQNPYPWHPHSYSYYYFRLFSHCRLSIKNVFECGLGTNNVDVPSNMTATGKPGASLRGWRDFFVNANVYGADVDDRVLFEEERIKTFFVDQTSSELVRKMWDNIGVTEFDIIIDDGLHTFDAGIVFFENSINKLSKNGVFIIEDVKFSYMRDFANYFKDKSYIVDFIVMPNEVLEDNNLIVIRKI